MNMKYGLIILTIYLVLIVSGCSEGGCGEEGCGCGGGEDCECVPDNPDDPTAGGHYECEGGDECGGCSCDEDDSKDGESCNYP